MRHPTAGPRLIQKDDRDSDIGRGCVEFAWHHMPWMAELRRAAAASAPLSAQSVRFTEGHRNIRDSRDRHEDHLALDITVEMPGEIRASETEYRAMVQRMRIFLGPAWEFEVHGEGRREHIHAEYEPRRLL